MSKLCRFQVLENRKIAKNTYSLLLYGDCSEITASGQFVNIAVEGVFSDQPIPVCKVTKETLNVVYKINEDKMLKLSQMSEGDTLDILTGIGNGFKTNISATAPLLIGYDSGVASLFMLAEHLLTGGFKPRAVIGFNSQDEVFLAGELVTLGIPTAISTLDGSLGAKGAVSDAVRRIGMQFDYVFASGPETMLKAVYDMSEADGQYCFSQRFINGFGDCMFRSGNKDDMRIFKGGPVLSRREIIW